MAGLGRAGGIDGALSRPVTDFAAGPSSARSSSSGSRRFSRKCPTAPSPTRWGWMKALSERAVRKIPHPTPGTPNKTGRPVRNIPHPARRTIDGDVSGQNCPPDARNVPGNGEARGQNCPAGAADGRRARDGIKLRNCSLIGLAVTAVLNVRQLRPWGTSRQGPPARGRFPCPKPSEERLGPSRRVPAKRAPSRHVARCKIFGGLPSVCTFGIASVSRRPSERQVRLGPKVPIVGGARSRPPKNCHHIDRVFCGAARATFFMALLYVGAEGPSVRKRTLAYCTQCYGWV